MTQRGQRRGERAAIVPLRALAIDERRHNLPEQFTSFIGRESEIAQVRGLLETTRLLTLTGPGGVGKSRLALQVAVELFDIELDGVWLVDLAGLSDETLVPQAVATTLGISQRPPHSLTVTLGEALRTQHLLLILDNCEHLLNACATLADGLLRACPDVCIVATSRQSLGLAGETSWPVPPLAPPELDGDLQPERMAKNEAVRLFVERAKAVRPAFALSRENAPAVAQVCRRLDGIPLAIELAAARIRALTAREIADRLDDRFQLLTSGSRTALRRQRALRDMVDWSYTLLSEPERILLRRLTVFAGGWTLEAAEAVCADIPPQAETTPPLIPPASRGEGLRSIPPARGGDRGGVATNEVFDALVGLVDKSLVVADDWRGSTRYRFLDTIRYYALDRLRDAGEDHMLRERHRDWCVGLAERAEREFLGGQQAEWLVRIDAEIENVRAALAWSTAEGPPEPGLAIAGALWLFWDIRGYLAEGSMWLSTLLARPPRKPSPGRVVTLVVAAYLAYTRGDLAATQRYAEEAVDLAPKVHDSLALGYTRLAQAAMLRYQGDFDRAQGYYDEARALARNGGHEFLDTLAAYHLAEMARLQGDYDRAAALYEECRTACEVRGDDYHRCFQLAGLAHIALLRGDNRFAAEQYQQVLALWRDLKDMRNVPWGLRGIAWVASAQGRAERAAWLFGAAEALAETVGAPLLPQLQADHERAVAAARAELGEDAFAAVRAAGRASRWDEAVAYALSSADTAPDRATEAGSVQVGSPLSEREREVAALVARGLTNQQIAAELVVSQRTAESHVYHILQKLGLTSRAQIAIWAADHGLRDGRPE